MDEGEHKQNRAKDVAWVVGRMDLSNENVSETSENQNMPSWSAFNSLVADENVPLKIVGFLPVLPFPVTEYATVYTSLENFQDILSKSDQSHLPVACNEGVYHIARETIMQNPQEFDNILLVLGSFHLIKVVMGAMENSLTEVGRKLSWLSPMLLGQMWFDPSLIVHITHVR